METKLKKILQDKDMTQSDLCALLRGKGCDITESSMSRIVNGLQDLMVYNTLHPICLALKVTPKEVVEGKWTTALEKEFKEKETTEKNNQ